MRIDDDINTIFLYYNIKKKKSSARRKLHDGRSALLYI